MKLLLISNSTNAGEQYLEYPKQNIKEFLHSEPVKALFIPYAGVTISYDDYEAKVKTRFNEIGHDIISIHHFEDPVAAVNQAEAIVIGGGNTFQLINLLQKNKLIEPIRERVLKGAPYIGWSAGANVACPTICTTNDMPIVQPESFKALGLVKFQINPHYLDANPEGHAGETREMRLQEYMILNPKVMVVGLREGTMICIEDTYIRYIGKRNVRINMYTAAHPLELDESSNIDLLIS